MQLGKLNLKKLKKDQLLILLLAGVLLIVIAIPTGKSSKEKSEDQQPAETATEEAVSDSYEQQMERRLKNTLEKVEGVGKVEVMITTKSTKEKVVEKDQTSTREVVSETDSGGGTRETTQTDTQGTTVYSQESGGQVPYVIKELEPEIEGVIIIAEGGGDANVVQNITDAVKALFHVEAHKIIVMKMV